MSCCELIQDPLHNQKKPIVGRAQSTMRDIEALRTLKSRHATNSPRSSKHVIYSHDPKLNALRHSLLLAHSNDEIALIHCYIACLEQMFAEQKNSRFLAEVYKLLVVANCYLAWFHRRDGIERAQSFITLAKNLVPNLPKTIPHELTETLLPYMVEVIENTQLMVEHTLSLTDMLLFEVQFKQLTDPHRTSNSKNGETDDKSAEVVPIRDIILTEIPKLEENVDSRFVLMSDELRSRVAQFTITSKRFVLPHAAQLFLKDFYPAATNNEQVLATLFTCA